MMQPVTDPRRIYRAQLRAWAARLRTTTTVPRVPMFVRVIAEEMREAADALEGTVASPVEPADEICPRCKEPYSEHELRCNE